MSNQIVPISATLYWPFLDKRNDMSDKYQVDLGNLSEKAVNALEMLGISVRNKGDDRGDYITVKSTYPIEPEFAGDPIDSGLIGNGSKASAAITPYDWQFKGKSGRSPSLKKLRITEVVVYVKEDDDTGIDLSDVL